MSKLKPGNYTIKLSAAPASFDGATDPWGRKWIFMAKTGSLTGTGSDYKEALRDLISKLEFPS